MSEYECTECGYVYDESKGDASQHIAPGTSFDDLPHDWTCPICGADRSYFVKV